MGEVVSIGLKPYTVKLDHKHSSVIVPITVFGMSERLVRRNAESTLKQLHLAQVYTIRSITPGIDGGIVTEHEMKEI